MGIKKEDVHSPTFILKKEYQGDGILFKKLIHVDAYRFEAPEEAKVLALDKDHLDHETLIVIEWPSKLGGILDEDMTVTFSVIDDEKREMEINYAGTKVEAKVSEKSIASSYFRL